MVRLDSITLPNLMGNRRVFPELVSVGKSEPAIDFLTKSIDAMLGDQFYLRGLLASLDQLCDQYAQPGASGRAAEWICDSLGAAKPVGRPEGFVSQSRRAA